jgi:hypothetical protein
VDVKNGFPSGDYTPFGYLDNPWHTWKLRRAGLVRTVFPARAIWHYPNVSNCVAALSLHFGLAVGGTTLLTGRESPPATGEVSCPYHSKDLMVHRVRVGQVELEVEFAMGAEDLLLCACHLRNLSDQPQHPTLLVLVSLVVLQDCSGLWQFGAAARYQHDARTLLLRSFAEGPAFAVRPTAEPEAVTLLAPGSPWAEEVLATWEQIFPRLEMGTNCSGALFEIPLALGAGGARVVECRVARGWSELELMAGLQRQMPRARQVIAARRREDELFWSHCPQLEGDWPAHWRPKSIFNSFC